MLDLSRRHRDTLEAIYEVRGNVEWRRVQALLLALGCYVDLKREGSRVAVRLNEAKMILHRPHPRRELSRRQVGAVRDFLWAAGVAP